MPTPRNKCSTLHFSQVLAASCACCDSCCTCLVLTVRASVFDQEPAVTLTIFPLRWSMYVMFMTPAALLRVRRCAAFVSEAPVAMEAPQEPNLAHHTWKCTRKRRRRRYALNQCCCGALVSFSQASQVHFVCHCFSQTVQTCWRMRAHQQMPKHLHMSFYRSTLPSSATQDGHSAVTVASLSRSL